MYVCCENACFDWYLCRLWSLSRANEMNSPRISCFDLRSSCSTSCREVTNLHLAILATNSGGRCINHLDCNHIKYSLMVHYYECIYDINWYKIGHYLFWDDMILICFHLIKNGYIWVYMINWLYDIYNITGYDAKSNDDLLLISFLEKDLPCLNLI